MGVRCTDAAKHRVLRGTLLWAILVIVASVCKTATGASDDPRCAGYVCAASVNPDFPSDPSTCAYGSCPACLVGEEWDARRRELGTGQAERAFVPSLVFGDWLSTELTETAFRILAEEMLGFRVNGMPSYVDGFDILCCDEDLVYMEKWPGENYPEDEGFFSLTQVPVGYEGGSSLFVSSFTLDEYPLATAFNAFRYLPDYQSIFPRGLSTPCQEALVDDESGCVDGNYICDENTWSNASCAHQGRYVPPLCAADPASCQEIYHVHPGYESGFFESLVKNNQLKFVIVYIGYERLAERLEAMRDANEHAIYYAWEPDPLVAQMESQAIVFRTPTAECRRLENSDPTLSGGFCDYGRHALRKVARSSSLNKDLDFRFFFESFSLSNTDLQSMMQQHVAGGGDRDVYNVTCEWLRENYGTWNSWIRNTPTNPPPASSISPGIIAAAVAVPTVLIVAGVIVLLVLRRRQIAASTRNAPTTPPLVLMFTDVESSTALWEHHGNDMARAIEIHHAVIRELLEEHQCYEVKVVGDSFFVAASTLVDGVMLALAIQRRLNDASWPGALRNWKGVSEAEEGPAELWTGLRVRIGLHYCLEVQPQFDNVHLRYDYYGSDVNTTARIESVAQGGQILMSAETHQRLLEEPDYANAIGDDAIAIKFASGVELKGVSEPLTLYSYTPVTLAGRRFQPIPGAQDEVTAFGETPSQSDVHSQISTVQRQSSEIATTVRLTFSAIPETKMRATILEQVLKQRKITASGSYQRKLKALINNIESEVAPQRMLMSGRDNRDEFVGSINKAPLFTGISEGSVTLPGVPEN